MKFHYSLKSGWKRRAIVDLPWRTWDLLGRPSFLSQVDILVVKNLHVRVGPTS